MQVVYFLIFLGTVCYVSCNGQANPVQANNSVILQKPASESAFNTSFLKANATVELDDNIRCIFQDQHDTYWFGTNGAGVYRYDGKSLIQFSEKDGLPNNQIQSIQEDMSGNIWFSTGLFGVSQFDGQSFTTFTTKESIPSGKSVGHKGEIASDDLWFYAGGGVFRSNGNSLTYLPLSTDGSTSTDLHSAPYNLSRYAVYCMLKDKKGNLWFGTQAEGVCMYNGKSFTWFTDFGLAGPAVLGLFEDSKGTLWFGNNGAGLFRYDGKALLNFTEDRGLSNPEFRLSGKSGPNSLARIYSINEDRGGDLWIGTVDAGVWRYDGTNLTQYSAKDGLTSEAVNTIYKDNHGDLWFGTDEDGVFRFNGRNFEKCIVD